MKSSPLLNWRTTNPSDASKRPVDLSTSGSSSTRQTISERGVSVSALRTGAAAFLSFFLVSGIVSMMDVYPPGSDRIVDLGRMRERRNLRAGKYVRCDEASLAKFAPDQCCQRRIAHCFHIV